MAETEGSASTANGAVPRGSRAQRWVTPSVIGIMLFIRLPVETGLLTFSRLPAWVDPYLVNAATYALTAFLIWWEWDRLALFHIDSLAIGMLILFKPIETIISTHYNKTSLTALPHVPALMIWATSAMLLALLITRRPRLAWPGRKAWLWLLVGLLAGAAEGLAFGYPTFMQVPGRRTMPIDQLRQGIHRWNPLSSFPSKTLMGIGFQTGYAAAVEEPVFRGFLWGWLREHGWRDVWVWLFQAFLFWLGHIFYRSGAPFSLWVLVPVAGLLYGLLAWRSRSIATSMMAHGAGNALTVYLGILIVGYLL